jgi:Gram-negative bacterial TonB protein C-terminal
MKKIILTLLVFLSLVMNGQNIKFNQINKENQKTGIWKLTSKNKDIEIVTEFLDGKYVSETKYYKDKKLVALYNNDLNEIVIINDSVSTKAKFNINEDSSRNLVRIDGTDIEEEISNYFYSFSELDPLYEGGIEKFYVFMAKNLSLGNFHGMLKIQFKIDSNGVVNFMKLIEVDDEKLEKEAKKVFQKMPRWQPAHKNGICIDTIMIFPLNVN